VDQAMDNADEDPINAIKIHPLKITVPVTNPRYLALQKAGILFGGQTFTTTLYYISLGPAEILTIPGEIFPELLYGVENFHRNDCPEANTGRPYEPGIFPLTKATYHFVLGLANDELGYIVPQYDFFPLPPKTWPPDGREVADACAANGVPAHYHETNSASYELAPTLTCAYVQLLGGDLSSYKACEAYLKALSAQ